MPDSELTSRFNDILAELTKSQLVTTHLDRFPGFDQHSPVPSHDKLKEAMTGLVTLSHIASNLHAWPEDSTLGHLDDIVSAIGWLSEKSDGQFKGESATLFNESFLKDPKNATFAHELEFALTVLEKQSPETWDHIQNHTALTMLYFERQCAAEDKVRGTPPGTAFHEREDEALLLMLGALGHDIGKLAIAPDLLHKATRIDPDHLDAAIAQYDKTVPDYTEKEHDMAFLRSANEGKIIFATERDKEKFPEATLILNVGAGYSHGEQALTDEMTRQRHSAIWERINQKGQSLPGWLKPDEQKSLTIPKRGTVTDHEMAVIATHDEMSEAFFKAASVPNHFKTLTHIVSMDRFRRGKGEAPKLNDEETKLANIVHATDVLEALLAPRSYREALPVEQAIKIMRDDASKGVLRNEIIDHITRNGTLEIYQPRGTEVPQTFAEKAKPIEPFGIPTPLAAALMSTASVVR